MLRSSMYASKLHIVAPGEIAEAAAFVAANSEHTHTTIKRNVTWW